MSEEPKKPEFVHSQEYIENNLRIQQAERSVVSGLCGNSDWRANESYRRQLDFLRAKQITLEKLDRDRYELALVNWELQKIEEERTRKRIEELDKVWSESPIMGMEV